MKTASELISLLEAQEKALAERIKILEQQEKGLQQNPDLNKDLLGKVNQEIVDTMAEKSEVTASKKQITAGNKFDMGLMVESMRDFGDILDVSAQVAQAVLSPAETPNIQDLQSALNKPLLQVEASIIEVNNAANSPGLKGELLTNPTENSKTFHEVISDEKNKLKDQTEDIEEKIKEAWELTHETPELKSAAAREWNESITKKEKELTESHTKQLSALDQNERILDKQMEDAKTLPKTLKNLEPLKLNISDERDKINDKFDNKKEEIAIEKKAFQIAMDTTKQMGAEEQQKAVENQRREFEMQRERERLKEIQSRTGP